MIIAAVMVNLWTVIFVQLNIFLIGGMAYAIYNLYKKNVKLENAVEKQNTVFEKLYALIKQSDYQLGEIDQSGTFRSDDEVGFFFEGLKEIQSVMNDFVIENSNPTDEK